MKVLIWQIALAFYMALEAATLLTNIEVVWMGVLKGLTALVVVVFILWQK